MDEHKPVSHISTMAHMLNFMMVFNTAQMVKLGFQLPHGPQPGEVLNGTWQHGQPVVPFVSRCHGHAGPGQKQHPGLFFFLPLRSAFWLSGVWIMSQ
jgi:hypothetical protein